MEEHIDSLGQKTLQPHQCKNRPHAATTTPLQVKQQPQSRPNDDINVEVIALLQRAIQLLGETRNQK
jgi:hypothetical protein